MKQFVVLSDFGCISSVGKGKAALWENTVRNPRSGIQCVTKGGRDIHLAVIPDDTTIDLPVPYGNRVNRLLHAALEEIAPSVRIAAGKYGKDRIGVCIGSCDNGSEESQRALANYYKTGVFPDGYTLEQQRADLPARYAAWYLDAAGPCLTFSTACASSASALVSARSLILSGVCNAVVAGGADIVSDAVALGFSALEAVSEKPCNPFSANRSGISLGEAAAVFLVTRDDICNRGIVLAGAGESCDAHHMTAPDPSGEGAAAAMKRALDDSGLPPGSIGYLNLHGTGTRLNDAMESRAAAAVFNAPLPVSSTKAITGHTLGAAGALEAGLCWIALSDYNPDNSLPVQLWDKEYDPELPQLDFISEPRTVPELRACMSNSFAFGGCNVSVLLAKKNRM